MGKKCDTILEATGYLESEISVGEVVVLNLEKKEGKPGFNKGNFLVLSEVSKKTKEYFPSKENIEIYFVIDKKQGGIFVMYLNELNEVEIVSPIPFEE